MLDGDDPSDTRLRVERLRVVLKQLTPKCCAVLVLRCPPSRLPTSAGESLVIADRNGDGRPDLVSGGSALVAVLLQDPTRPGYFLALQNLP